MKLPIDMNLSPAWAPILNQAGHNTIHWSAIGSPRSTDTEILTWAREHNHVVFTHDLDFGAILAATDADSPSVIQIRTEDPTPDACGALVVDAIQRHADSIVSGALITIDKSRSRIRVLPLKRQ